MILRISGIEILSHKHLPYALTRIHGIGFSSACDICDALNFAHDAFVRDLSKEDESKIHDHIMNNYVVEHNLRRDVLNCISEMKHMGSYKGLRHVRGLPVRGQRTHTNARTRKGRAVPIAGKKG